MNLEIEKTVEYLQQGKIILYPTDTIWGLGCDPFNQEAVDRIFELKERPAGKPLIILVDGVAMLKETITTLHPHLENILEYNVRPLTVIYDDVTRKYADGIAAEDGSVAIRIVRNDFCKQIISRFRHPIVSTSANRSNHPFPKSLAEIHPDIREKADYVVCPPGYKEDEDPEPSLIARYSPHDKELIFLRS